MRRQTAAEPRGTITDDTEECQDSVHCYIANVSTPRTAMPPDPYSPRALIHQARAIHLLLIALIFFYIISITYFGVVTSPLLAHRKVLTVPKSEVKERPLSHIRCHVSASIEIDWQMALARRLYSNLWCALCAQLLSATADVYIDWRKLEISRH